MQRRMRHRVVVAWVLLLALMPVYIVKSTHFHNITDAAVSHTHGAGQAQGDHSDCLICHFILSPCVEAQSVDFVFSAPPVFDTVADCSQDVVVRKLRTNGLRGPPSDVL